MEFEAAWNELAGTLMLDIELAETTDPELVVAMERPVGDCSIEVVLPRPVFGALEEGCPYEEVPVAVLARSLADAGDALCSYDDELRSVEADEEVAIIVENNVDNVVLLVLVRLVLVVVSFDKAGAVNSGLTGRSCACATKSVQVLPEIAPIVTGSHDVKSTCESAKAAMSVFPLQ
jgi:hypothetical protein